MKKLFLILFGLVASVNSLFIPGFINGKPLRHHLDDTLYPEIKDTDCSFVKEEWFNATVDNFNSSNKETWRQKYQVNDINFNATAPNPVIFLMIGGEGTAVNKWVCWSNYTYMKLVAKYNALAIQLEHRFFGYSYPKFAQAGFGDMSTDTLKLLTSQQALADLANFIKSYTYNGNSMTNAKWVAVGGSYPGSLCAWFRAQYPDLTVGGICSSAPLWAKVDFYEYAQVMESALTDYDSKCADNIKKGFALLKNSSYTEDGRQRLNNLFNIQPPLDAYNSTDFDLDITNFFANVFDKFQGVVQYTFDAANNLTINGLGIDTLCSIANNNSIGTDSLDRIKEIFFWAINSNSVEMINITHNNYAEMIAPYQRTSFNVSDEVDQEIAAGRGWM
ncbi:hypothetical protein FO519_006994, partial [Halicephalobus sp. NKZ332]